MKIIPATLSALFGALALCACGGDDTTVAAKPPPKTGCGPGALELDGGACQPAGIPADACGEGFTPDGDSGCDPILPPDPCPAGQMAVPGDSACREVAPCGDGTWGDIPVEATTQFVDQSYAGGISDGSQARPWTRIADAVAKASSGAIVAIAAGTYAEGVDLRFKPVRLWGRCPSMVTLTAGTDLYGMVFFEDGVSGAELHDVAIEGPGQAAFALSGSQGVLLDRIWIHDVAGRGVALQDDFGPAEVTVSRSLIEATTEFAVYVSAAKITLDGSVVRDTRAAADGHFGRGVEVQMNVPTNGRSEALVRDCLIERNRDLGIYIEASDATIERSVVRDTVERAVDGTRGRGIEIEQDLTTGERSTVAVTTSLLERNHEVALLVGNGTLSVDATVVRDTRASAAEQFGGYGIEIEDDVGGPSDATVKASLLERNLGAGILVDGSSVVAQGVRIRNTGPNIQGRGGGISVQHGLVDPTRVSNAALTGIAIEHSLAFGLLVDGNATIEGCAVSDTQPNDGTGAFGDDLDVYDVTPTQTAAVVTGSLFTGASRAGVAVFGGTASLSTTTIDCSAIDLDAEAFGSFAPKLADLGGNTCGCNGTSRPCNVLTSDLAPPTPPSAAQ